MQIDVSDILQQGEGAQADFTVQGEKPQLEGLKLTRPLTGDIRIIGISEGLLATGSLNAAIELECHRCLRAFEHELEVPIESEFSLKPDEEQFPIDKHGRIDLDEPVRQEIEVHLPLQQLCQADCKGIT